MSKTKNVINALPLVADVLGRKYGVKVHIGGEQAYTDGKDIHIPALPLDADDDTLNLARGYLDHEAAHLRHTDFGSFQQANLKPIEKQVWNTIEDFMVEKALSKTYPGCKNNFEWLVRYLFLNKNHSDEPASAVDIFNWLLLNLRSLQVPELKEECEKLEVRIDGLYPDLRMHLEPVIGSIPDNATDTTANIGIARKIVKILRKYLEPAKPDGSMKNQDNNAQKQDSQKNNNQNSQKSSTTTQAIKSLKEVMDDPSALEKLNIGEKLGEMLSGISQGNGDKLSVAIPMPGRVSAFSPDEIAETRKVTNALRTRLQALLQASVLTRNHPAHSGRIDASRLTRLFTGKTKLFMRHGRKVGINTSVHILLDASGSMRGKKIYLASHACYALASALYNIKDVSIAVTAFPGGIKYLSGNDCTWKTVAPILLYKSRLHNRFAVSCDGYTPMAEALWWLMPQICQLQENRKIILIISDGIPDNTGEAKNAVAAHRAHGHEVYGIGIEHHALEQMLTEKYAKTIYNLNELASAMFDILRTAMLNKKGGGNENAA